MKIHGGIPGEISDKWYILVGGRRREFYTMDLK